MKERASPRRDVCFVPRKHSAEPRGDGTLYGLFTVCERAVGAIYKFRSRKNSSIIQYSMFNVHYSFSLPPPRRQELKACFGFSLGEAPRTGNRAR